MTPCKKKAELQTLLQLIATLWMQGKMSGVRPENPFTATTSLPENRGRGKIIEHWSENGRITCVKVVGYCD